MSSRVGNETDERSKVRGGGGRIGEECMPKKRASPRSRQGIGEALSSRPELRRGGEGRGGEKEKYARRRKKSMITRPRQSGREEQEPIWNFGSGAPRMKARAEPPGELDFIRQWKKMLERSPDSPS